LKSIQLHCISIIDGVFYHVGTSFELLHLLTSSMHDQETSILEAKFQRLKKRYRLQQHANSKLFNFHQMKPNPFDRYGFDLNLLQWNSKEVVSIGSCLGVTSSSCVGHHSVIESSIIVGECYLGNQCLVSHLRGDLGDSIRIPSGIMLQQIPLLGQTPRYVILTLGIRDNIKAPCHSKGIFRSEEKIIYFLYFLSRFYSLWSISIGATCGRCRFGRYLGRK
jgi:hypothetical protein